MRAVAFTLLLSLIVAACSLPRDDSAQVIAQAELAESLQRVTTTTTSTTLPQVLTREFAYYLLANKADSDQRVVRQVVATIGADDSLLSAIEPMDTEGFKATIGADDTLLNAVPQYDIVDLRIENGIATVWLTTLVTAPEDRPLRDVAAQLVWTLTGDDSVDAILVNIDGAPALLPTTNDANTTDQPVTTDDYAAYNREDDGEAATSTSTTTAQSTTTTVPPSDG